MSVVKFENYEDRAHALGSRVGKGLLPECSVGTGVETTEVEARLATYSLPLQIINNRLFAGSTNFDHDGPIIQLMTLV